MPVRKIITTSYVLFISVTPRNETVRNIPKYYRYNSFDNIIRNSEEFVEKPLRGSDIPHPARTLLIVDSGYSIIGWWHATDVPPETLDKTNIKDLWPFQKEDAINGRHPNKTVNVGFADGTVARIKANDLYVGNTDDNYMNRSPLWLPK